MGGGGVNRECSVLLSTRVNLLEKAEEEKDKL